MVTQTVQITKLYLIIEYSSCGIMNDLPTQSHSVTSTLSMFFSGPANLQELSTPHDMKDYEVHINSTRSLLCLSVHSECQ